MEFEFINFLLVELIPWLLRLVMVGLGLTLTLVDLKGVMLFPKGVVVGLTGQLILLPLLAFLLALLLAPTPAIAIGAIILAACPGGVTSNAYVFAARADVALSVTLTAIASFITVLTIPLLTYAALQIFAQQGQMPSLPMIGMFQTLALFTVVPVCIGMLIRVLWPSFALRAIEVLRPVTMAVLILIVLVTAVTSYETISEYFFQSSVLVVGLNLLSMAMGYGLARAFRLNAAQRVTIAFEVGVQNLSLALLVTLTLLGDPALAITTLLYVAVMPFTAMAYVPIARRMLGPTEAEAATGAA